MVETTPIKALPDPYNPTGSTSHVSFHSSKILRWETRHDLSHLNWAICDSTWEQQFCEVAENHPRVRAYVKNQSLGFEVPYKLGSEPKRYIPDFIVHIDDGREDPLQLVVEVKGYRGEDAKEKKNTMDAYWVPGVNRLRTYGRWAFLELRDHNTMNADFASAVEEYVKQAEEAETAAGTEQG